MSDTYTIRSVSLSERSIIETCARMMASAETWITLGINYDDCLKAFEGEGKEIYVLFDKDTPAGMVILQLTGTFSGYLQSICVHSSYRSKGLGSLLLNFSEVRIRKLSPNIFLCVSDFNTKAQKLYERAGYTKVGELPDFVTKGFTEYLMRKSFGPNLHYAPPTE